MKYLLLLLVVIMSGCGVLRPSDDKKAARHLRKSKKHERLAIGYGAVIYPDTVFTEVKVLVPEVRFDTLVRVQNWTDTIVVSKDKVITRVVVKPETKEVYIDSKCDTVWVVEKYPSTITKRIEVPVTKEKKAMFIFLGILTGMGITFLLIWLIQRFVKRK